MKQFNKLIKNVSPKTVIAIDGYSGVGKTTLLKQLARQNRNILPIFMDDFILSPRTRKPLINKAKDRSKVFELHWYDYQKIKALVKRFKAGKGSYKVHVFNPKTGKKDLVKNFNLSKKVLIIEGVFLFHPRLFKNLFDVKVWLDLDIKKADRRRVAREKKRWGKDYFPEDHPDSYARLFKIAHARYRKKYQPKKQADLVIKI